MANDFHANLAHSKQHATGKMGKTQPQKWAGRRGQAACHQLTASSSVAFVVAAFNNLQ